MAKLTIGKLRHRVTLQSRTETQDPDTGVVTIGWGDHATDLPADIEPVSAREFIASQATQAHITTRIVIRHRDDVVPTMRVVHRGKVYNIEGVLPDKNSGLEYLTLVCSSGDNESGA